MSEMLNMMNGSKCTDLACTFVLVGSNQSNCAICWFVKFQPKPRGKPGLLFLKQFKGANGT